MPSSAPFTDLLRLLLMPGSIPRSLPEQRWAHNLQVLNRTLAFS